MNRGAFRIVGVGFAVIVASAAGCSEETDDGTGGGATTQTGTGGGTSTGTGGGTSTGTGGGTSTGTGGGTSTGIGGGGAGGASACIHDTSGCTSATCGDNTAEGFEWCDGTDFGQATDCTDVGLGFAGGTLACDGTCNYDTSGCNAPTCGDNNAEGGEPCDGTDLGSYGACTDHGYTGGTLACNADCSNADLSGCTGGPAGWTCNAGYYDAADGCDCGCGVVDPDCADATVGSCEFCSFTGSCAPSGSGCPGTINAADNSQCDAGGGTCGNNTLEGGEACDGTDLGGNDCTTLGVQFVSGTLACNANCQFFDASACVVGDPVCGNGVAETFESCDGADMGGLTATCVDAGFTGGDITCTNCQLDLTTCTGGTPGWTCPENFYGDGDCDCGCGVVDTDCADATAASCDYCNDAGSCGGFDDCGEPGSTINAADNSTCDAATCGNDTAQATEICDGADLRDIACEDLEQGFVGGTLVCSN